VCDKIVNENLEKRKDRKQKNYANFRVKMVSEYNSQLSKAK